MAKLRTSLRPYFYKAKLKGWVTVPKNKSTEVAQYARRFKEFRIARDKILRKTILYYKEGGIF